MLHRIIIISNKIFHTDLCTTTQHYQFRHVCLRIFWTSLCKTKCWSFLRFFFLLFRVVGIPNCTWTFMSMMNRLTLYLDYFALEICRYIHVYLHTYRLTFNVFTIAVVANESETVRISNRSVNISIRVNCGYLVATWSWPPTGCWIIVVRIVPSSPTFTHTSITLLDIFKIQNFAFFYFFFE